MHIGLKRCHAIGLNTESHSLHGRRRREEIATKKETQLGKKGQEKRPGADDIGLSEGLTDGLASSRVKLYKPIYLFIYLLFCHTQ